MESDSEDRKHVKGMDKSLITSEFSRVTQLTDPRQHRHDWTWMVERYSGDQWEQDFIGARIMWDSCPLVTDKTRDFVEHGDDTPLTFEDEHYHVLNWTVV